MSASLELTRRVAAAQATLDRYRDKGFAYGSGDCVQMAAFHLRRMGHVVVLSKGGAYRSALGAVKALRRAGHASIAAALDAHGLERIAPAAAIVGDIVALPAADGSPLEALTVALGNGRVIGWHVEVAGATVMQPVAFAAAWRVPVIVRS
jgi:hypothetical protein